MKAVNETKKKEGKYSVLYADVPWAEQSWSVESTSGLCVDNWTAKDALLMLWVPNAPVPDGLSVLGPGGLTMRDCCAGSSRMMRWRIFCPLAFVNI